MDVPSLCVFYAPASSRWGPVLAIDGGMPLCSAAFSSLERRMTITSPDRQLKNCSAEWRTLGIQVCPFFEDESRWTKSPSSLYEEDDAMLQTEESPVSSEDGTIAENWQARKLTKGWGATLSGEPILALFFSFSGCVCVVPFLEQGRLRRRE